MNHKILNITWIFVICSLCISCKKQLSVRSMSIDYIHVVEYNYLVNSDDCSSNLHIFGFSELNEAWNLKYATYGYDGFYYCNSNISISDNIKSHIAETLCHYSSDTTFLSPHKFRIYDGNHYLFIIKYQNDKTIMIKFEPKFLPNELRYVYDSIYGNLRDSIPMYGLNSLYRELKNTIEIFDHSDVQFLPPIVIDDIKE